LDQHRPVHERCPECGQLIFGPGKPLSKDTKTRKAVKIDRSKAKPGSPLHVPDRSGVGMPLSPH